MTIYIAIAPDPVTAIVSPAFIAVFKYSSLAVSQINKWREEGRPAYFVTKFIMN